VNYDQRHPSRFIKAGEFGGKPVTLTITSVVMEDIESEDGSVKASPIVSFRETKRLWRMNTTNDQSVSAMFGGDDEGWVGKRVTLVPEDDPSGLSDSGKCIRVKGSPDIKSPIEVTIKLPRRKPQKRRLIPIKMGANEPVFDGETGELSDGPGGFDDITWTGEGAS
jgi:hypothetical protein